MEEDHANQDREIAMQIVEEDLQLLEVSNGNCRVEELTIHNAASCSSQGPLTSTPKTKNIKSFKDINFNETYSPRTAHCALKICQKSKLIQQRKMRLLQRKLFHQKKKIKSLKALTQELKTKCRITENTSAVLEVLKFKNNFLFRIIFSLI